MSRKMLDLVTDNLAADTLSGAWIAALEECRSRTIEAVENVAELDHDHPLTGNSIGTLLYHIAAIEADWLYVEVKEEPFPARIAELFPWDVRDAEGRLTPVRDVELHDHLLRLEVVRQELVQTYREMDREEFQRLRALPDYDVSPMWVAHHLIQHEAGHRAEIEMLRDTLHEGRR